MSFLNKYSINFSPLRWAILFIVLLNSGCIQQQEVLHKHEDNLSGIWEYHSVYADPATNEFIDSHVHVKLTDDGNNVFLDHCLRDKAMSFVRNENLLTNENGQMLDIIHDDKISSVSVPALSHLIKSDASHDLENAGSIQIKSNLLPEINLVNNVCAQRTYRENDDTVILHLSLPFDDTYIDITLEIDKNNQTSDNLLSATFYSPNFIQYYDLNTIQALSGKVTFLALSETRTKFNFDIELQGQYNSFSVDRFKGFVDVTL